MRTTAATFIRATRMPMAFEAPPAEQVVVRLRPDPAQDRRDLLGGLRAQAASIAPKYFYDALGSALFGAICELPEYYPTRAERAIFTRHRSDIAAAIGAGKMFVDLGAGDCAKAADWIPFLAPSRYVAVDIAEGTLRTGLARVAQAFPELETLGVVTDFSAGLSLHEDLPAEAVTFFYPGSSIGNFLPQDAARFIADVRAHCDTPGSGLLIGVDTRKDATRLEAAYADALGVTAAFNRNVLLHVNRLLGCDFDPQAFRHVARYDSRLGRIEMHLEALRDVTVHLDGVPRRFVAGERIHTENSYKYTPADFASMLGAAGFASVATWQDDDGDFAVHYAAAHA